MQGKNVRSSIKLKGQFVRFSYCFSLNLLKNEPTLSTEKGNRGDETLKMSVNCIVEMITRTSMRINSTSFAEKSRITLQCLPLS